MWEHINKATRIEKLDYRTADLARNHKRPLKKMRLTDGFQC